MSDSACAGLYAFLGLGSLAGITVDVVFCPRWWILIPLFVVLVSDIAWGILEVG